MTFSQISILYTDGSRDEEPEFESLEFKKWRGKYEQAKLQKLKNVREAVIYSIEYEAIENS